MANNGMRVAVTGATGLIGTALVAALERDGVRVNRIVRSAPRPERGDVEWQPRQGRIDVAALEGVDAVVHLAGETVGERWSDEKKRRIRQSRLEGTALLARALAELERPPAVLVSASAVGIYGDRGDEVLDEESGPGDDFLAELGQEWEAAAGPAARAGIRVVHPRLGIVLARGGGVLGRMLLPIRLGVGGPLGSGRQWMSWISIDDVVRGIRFLIERNDLAGAFNFAAPAPATNRDFTRTLGRLVHRPTFFAAPAPALRLAFGEMADVVLLASQRALPRRLQAAGFDFRHPDLEGALRAEL